MKQLVNVRSLCPTVGQKVKKSPIPINKLSKWQHPWPFRLKKASLIHRFIRRRLLKPERQTFIPASSLTTTILIFVNILGSVCNVILLKTRCPFTNGTKLISNPDHKSSMKFDWSWRRTHLVKNYFVISFVLNRESILIVQAGMLDILLYYQKKNESKETIVMN